MAKPIKTVSTVVSRIDDLGSDTKRFTLVDQDDWELPPFKPGGHIDVHLEPGLVRTYSLCNEPEDNHRYVIAVKREHNGRGGSNFLHERVSVGDPIGVSVPRGGIALNPNGMNVFVAGGIGVTPFISVVRHLERRGCTNYALHWTSRGRPVLPDMIGPAIEAGRVHLYDTTSQCEARHRRHLEGIQRAPALRRVAALRRCSKPSKKLSRLGRTSVSTSRCSRRRSGASRATCPPMKWC